MNKLHQIPKQCEERTKITSIKSPINFCWIIYKVLLLLIVRLVHFLFSFSVFYLHNLLSIIHCLSVRLSFNRYIDVWITERHIVSIAPSASSPILGRLRRIIIIIIWMHEIHSINILSKPRVWMRACVCVCVCLYHGQRINMLRNMSSVSLFYWWILSFSMYKIEFQTMYNMCMSITNLLKRIVAH